MAGRRHRLIRVGDGEDPGLDRDLVRAQTERVALAVQPLVVGAHPAGDVVHPRMLEDPGPDLGVATHLSPLLCRERARLEQDRVGDADLSEVVEHTGGVDPLKPFLRDAERPRRVPA